MAQVVVADWDLARSVVSLTPVLSVLLFSGSADASFDLAGDVELFVVLPCVYLGWLESFG